MTEERSNFEGSGKYSKVPVAASFSPLIDFSIAAHFKSKTQIARLVLETWAEFNLFCLNCESDELVRLAANTPVADFECGVCKARYQLKGKDGRFSSLIPGAAYGPTIEAVRTGSCPHYMLVEYDRRFETVVFCVAIRGSLITEERVLARARLKETAKRAGWVGCSVRVDHLPHVAVVQPRVVVPAIARLQWASGERLR